MKRLIILIAALLVVGGLGYYAVQLMKNSGKSDLELFDFNIANVDDITKFTIEDPYGYSFEVHKKGKEWVDKDGNCVVKENVDFILEAFKKIEFKGYLPENSKETFTKQMLGKHTKVQIFVNGEWDKTWYIGPAAPDHYSQVMLLESAEKGKSDYPVMMGMKGHNGFIDPIFFADPRKWQCTGVFKLSLNEINKVEVKYNFEPWRSFTVARVKDGFEVYQENKKLENVPNANILRYLNNYKSIHFNHPNYTLNEKQVDSLKKTTPFAKLTLTENSHVETKLRMWYVPSSNPTTNEFGQVVNNDMDKFWCELPSGQLVKCQFFVFNPILLGHIYFPLDLTQQNLENPETFTIDKFKN